MSDQTTTSTIAYLLLLARRPYDSSADDSGARAPPLVGGGTPSDIALGTYDLQTGNTNHWDPIASYFTSPNDFSDETLQQMWEWYRYGCQTLIYTASSTTGDKVVTN